MSNETFEKPLGRRNFLRASALAGSTLLVRPAWARGSDLSQPLIRQGFDEVSGETIELRVGRGPRCVEGRAGRGIAVNGSVPGPLIRLREGDPVT
ncbi:twin-arginine translocation signal domain-containing protein, partial [Stakelama marina]